MADPWSIVADHPINGQPFGLVIHDNTDPTHIEAIARHLLTSYSLTGSYLPTTPTKTTGLYLLRYLRPSGTTHLACIWAHSIEDAKLRMQTLAENGILFMTTPG